MHIKMDENDVFLTKHFKCGVVLQSENFKKCLVLNTQQRLCYYNNKVINYVLNTIVSNSGMRRYSLRFKTLSNGYAFSLFYDKEFKIAAFVF